MSDVETVSPDAETQIPATDETKAETPEVATPEPEEKPDPAEAERLERDKAIRRMERRIDRKHAEAAEARARVQFLEEQLRSVQPKQQEAEPAPVTREQFERAVAERAREVASIERVNEQCNRIADQGKKEFPDFQDAIANVAQEVALFDQRGNPTTFMRVVLKADNAAAVLHHLGKNPDLAAELADMDPIDQAVRLADIRREMVAKPSRSPSGAPKPLEPVKGKAKSDEPPITDTARWIEWSNKQDQLKRQQRHR